MPPKKKIVPSSEDKFLIDFDDLRQAMNVQLPSLAGCEESQVNEATASASVSKGVNSSKKPCTKVEKHNALLPALAAFQAQKPPQKVLDKVMSMLDRVETPDEANEVFYTMPGVLKVLKNCWRAQKVSRILQIGSKADG